MSQESRFASAGVAVVLGAAAIFLYRRLEPPAPPPRPASSARAAEREHEGDRPSEAESTSRAEARRSRDTMRTDILAALRRRDAGAPPPAPSARPRAAAAPSSAPADAPHGHYEASYIQEHFREDMFPLIKQCYESALKRKPDLGGKLILKFGIVGDPSVGGIVEGAEFADASDLKDPEMETCVRETVMTLTFDKPPTGGGYVSVTYPILFAPGDEPPPEDDGGAPAPAP